MESLREKWIAALRSGEYEQGTGMLRCNNGHEKFCCIGVACDLADSSWSGGQWRGMYTGDAVDFLGIPVIQAERMVCMNDKEFCSFPEIADYIEAHPEIDPKWTPEGE